MDRPSPAPARPGADGPPHRLDRTRAAGQGIVEYGLILALSTVVAVVVLLFFGPTLSAVLDAIADAIDLAG